MIIFMFKTTIIIYFFILLLLLQSQWVWLSLRCNKTLPIAPFSPFRDRLFSTIVACPSRLSRSDRQSIWSMITYHGGQFRANLDPSCTHLITSSMKGSKYEMAMSRCSKLKIVSPDWLVDSMKNQILCEEERYHPKLLITHNIGKVVKHSDRRTKKQSGDDANHHPQTSSDDSIFTKTTKSVTMAISTEAVVRKVDPYKSELVDHSGSADEVALKNVQTINRSVPNPSSILVSSSSLFIRSKPSQQQSKTVQSGSVGTTTTTSSQLNRHICAQVATNQQISKQTLPLQVNKTTLGQQVHAVKSKVTQPPKLVKAKSPNNSQELSYTQQYQQGDSSSSSILSPNQRAHSSSPSNYHLHQQSQQLSVPMMSHQQMTQQHIQPKHQQQPPYRSPSGLPQSPQAQTLQQQPRQVYLPLQQQQQPPPPPQQISFSNGQATPFVRQQHFIVRPPQSNMIPNQQPAPPQPQQQQLQQSPHPQIGSCHSNVNMHTSGQQQQQQQQQMFRQFQQRPVGQYSGQQTQQSVYINQQQNPVQIQRQRFTMQPQQQQQQQQVMINKVCEFYFLFSLLLTILSTKKRINIIK